MESELDKDSPVSEFVGWTTQKQRHAFYGYEPWDGPDGVEPRHTKGGARFQKACQLSTKYMRASVAANQIGKTYDRAIECIEMLSGELPYCFRYAAGVDTGIARMLPSEHPAIGRNNVIRWGRRSKTDGTILDHNETAEEDGSWDCGNIVGVGPYPAEKICYENGQQIWVCSYKQARDDTWIDLFRMLIPEHCLDKTKGTEGYSKSDCIFYLQENKSIRLKTYDQGWERVESRKVWHIVFDEEPPDRKYYTGCVLHAYTLSFSYTPLRGMSWSYTDLYERWQNGDQDIEFFHATKYDCPYNKVSEVERQERQLTGWEREPKIYGRYSQQEGKPYYDFDLCKKYIIEHVPRHRLVTIYPKRRCQNVQEVYRSDMVVKPATLEAPDTWEQYEDVMVRTGYWVGVDCARGNDDSEKAQDKSAAYIFRMPCPERGEDPEWPVCVAALHSSDLTESFAMMVLYGATYYNLALINPETKGEDGTAFLVEIKDYPFWFKMTVINNKTRRPTENIGFDTNARTRTPLFNKQRKYINAHEEKSHIPHHALLLEQSRIIWLKGRPDHPDNGTSDCVIAWCLGLWVWEEAIHQVRDNSKVFRKLDYDDSSDHAIPEIILGLHKNRKYETRPVLGSSTGMDTRRREQWRDQQKQKNQRQSPSQKTLSKLSRQQSKMPVIY